MFTPEANFAFTESLNAFGFNGQKTAEDIFRFESQFLVKKNAFRFTHAPEPGVFFAEVSQIWWRVRKLFFEAIKLAAKDEVLIQKTEQQSCTREETRRSFFYILFGTLQLLFPQPLYVSGSYMFRTRVFRRATVGFSFTRFMQIIVCRVVFGASVPWSLGTMDIPRHTYTSSQETAKL